MENFVRRQNIERYRSLLEREPGPAERARLQQLLDEELAKDAPPRSRPEEGARPLARPGSQ